MKKNWMIDHIETQRRLSIQAIKNGNWNEAAKRTQEEIRFTETCRLQMLEELEKGNVWTAAEYVI